jgi:hypothetical protein
MADGSDPEEVVFVVAVLGFFTFIAESALPLRRLWIVDGFMVDVFFVIFAVVLVALGRA